MIQNKHIFYPLAFFLSVGTVAKYIWSPNLHQMYTAFLLVYEEVATARHCPLLFLVMNVLMQHSNSITKQLLFLQERLYVCI